MSETESIQSILGESPFVTGETAAPPAAETETETPVGKPEVKPEPEERSGPARDESGRFAKAGKAEEKPAEKPAEKRPDVAAIIDERRKRQEIERKYSELLQSQQGKASAPSVFENEDAAITSRVNEALKPYREAMYNSSIRAARNAYKENFEAAEQAFLEASERDERLLQGLRDSFDPGEYIYMHGMFHKELSGVGGDLMRYREHVTSGFTKQLTERDQQIAALKAENETLKKSQAELAAVPRSLNSESSPPAKAGDEDDTDINRIVRFK